MFEVEIKRIQEKTERSLEIRAEMQALHDKHWAGCSGNGNVYYYFDSKVSYEGDIYRYALSDLTKLIEKEAGGKVGFNRSNGSKGEFEKACSFVADYKNEDILNHFVFILTPYRYDNAARYSAKGDTVEIKSHYDYNLRLVLNVLNILVNDKIEDTEVYEKCREVLKQANTFVYRDVKITCYQNGKMKLVFAEEDLLSKMKKLLNQVRSSKDE